MNSTNGRTNGSVYFAQDIDLLLIKIGWSTDVPKRLQALANLHLISLRLLATIDGRMVLEAGLHQMFRDHRASSPFGTEWFRPSPGILNLIRTDGDIAAAVDVLPAESAVRRHAAHDRRLAEWRAGRVSA